MRLRYSQLLLTAALLLSAKSVVGQTNNVVKSDGEDIGLQIVGTISNSTSGANVALIREVESGKIEAVKTGFTVMKQFRVVEVKPKYVVLQRNNEFRIVYQNKFAGEFSNSAATLMKNNLSTYKEEGFERTDLSIRMTSTYRDRMVRDDLSQVLMQATAIPYSRDGRVLGFQLLQIDKDSIYDKSGFQDQDVITAINGQELNNVAGAVSLLQSLRRENSIELDVLRGGVPRKMSIRVD
jgi:type II secretory pathway component PulC